MKLIATVLALSLKQILLAQAVSAAKGLNFLLCLALHIQRVSVPGRGQPTGRQASLQHGYRGVPSTTIGRWLCWEPNPFSAATWSGWVSCSTVPAKRLANRPDHQGA